MLCNGPVGQMRRGRTREGDHRGAEATLLVDHRRMSPLQHQAAKHADSTFRSVI